MKKLALDKGRVRQKLKTRSDILEAAKQLLRKSKRISLDDVAEEAKISRATIYRYFPNVDLLISESSLDVYHITPEELQKKIMHLTSNEKILYLQEYYTHLAQKHETMFRRYLSTALAESVTNKRKIRGSRRVESLKKLLDRDNMKMSKGELDNLINISTLLMGIEALVVLKDVCDLNNSESSTTLKWGIEMILKGIQSDKG